MHETAEGADNHVTSGEDLFPQVAVVVLTTLTATMQNGVLCLKCTEKGAEAQAPRPIEIS